MERRIILERLAKKYESSDHLRHPGKSRRRVMLRVEKKELPEYQFEDATMRDAYNLAAEALRREGLIDLQWASDRPLMTHIYLKLDSIDRVYHELGRPHPAEQAGHFANALNDLAQSIDTVWIIHWAQALGQRVRETCRIPAVYLNNPRLMDDLLCALRHYDAMKGQSISIRAFSIKCYRDSKRFERDVQSEFLRIARQYNAELADYCMDEDIREREQLAFLGLLLRPELFEFSGKLILETEKGIIDISPLFPQGIALPSTQIVHIRKIHLAAINTVTFIENKTNYDTYILQELREDELAVYQGGFLSPSQRRLCQLFALSLTKDVSIRLWADIDLGGFRMFEQLRQIFPSLLPFRMSPKDVEDHREQGLARSESYLGALENALQENRFPLFEATVRSLLKYGITVEQEVYYI